jgi:alpha/beta superfamily hydrolase
MVLKGQFLERPTLIKVGKTTLEGLWHRGDRRPAALLLSPLPGSGSMDVAALNEMAFAASRSGHATLRFNYGGVGASQKPSKIDRLAEARAALKVLRESAEVKRAVVVGFRSGSHLAVDLIEEAEALILVSPPEDLDLEPLTESECTNLFILGQGDPHRMRLSGHCSQTGDRLEVIENADLAFNRGLPQLGRAVVEYLQELAGAAPGLD